MKISRVKTMFLICCFGLSKLYSSVSIVYNLRISETTKRQRLEQQFGYPFIAVVTLFDQWRNIKDGTHDNIGGGLGTFLYSTKSFYIRADFAAAHARESNKALDLRFSRTQTDDLLFSGGYSRVLNKRTKMTLSGILGIPTHKDLSPEGIQFGTGHVGLGVQLDGSFVYSANQKQILMAATRYIHFFPRTIVFDINNQNERFDFHVGNLIDLFIANLSNWGRHRLEIGYNPSFLFGAKIYPAFDEVVQQTNFIRSSFYSSYKYGFLIYRLPSAVTLGISYGFDHIPKKFGNKYIVTLWASWGLNF
ncbi:MAG: hypothetical protein WA432_04465 [Candidatus Babeliaceae bacterium]